MRSIGPSGVLKPGKFYTTPSASGPGTPDPTWITLTYASAGHSAALAQDLDGYTFTWGGVAAVAPVAQPGQMTTAHEAPWHPGSVLRAGVQGPNVGAPSIEDQIFTVQEQPFHPIGTVTALPLAATPVPATTHQAMTAQEAPYQPPGFVNQPVGLPSFVAEDPSQAASYAFARHSDALAQDLAGRALVSQVTHPSAIQVKPSVPPALTTQEQPWHPGPIVKAGVSGQNVRTPVSDHALSTQEAPYHPGPQAQSGVQGPNVRAGTSDRAASTQEIPWHPVATVRAGVQGPNVRSGTSDRAVSVQEQAWHPVGTVRPGVQGPNVLSATSDIATSVQEAPYHPGPHVRSAIAGPNVAPPISNRATNAQEIPWHPSPSLTWPGVPAPLTVTPRPPTNSQAVTVQELPWHPGSIVDAGVQGPNVNAPSISDVVLSTQEQPFHPVGTVTALPLAATPVPAGTHQATTVQEQPSHPGPSAAPGVFTQPAVTPVPPVKQATTVQEQPYHPTATVRGTFLTATWVGIAPLLSKQEDVLGHPAPFLRSNISVTVPGPVVGRAITVQEQPTHPSSTFVISSRTFTGPRTEVLRAFITRQEQPRENQSWGGMASTAFGIAPPPTTPGAEWLIRARRRGRR